MLDVLMGVQEFAPAASWSIENFLNNLDGSIRSIGGLALTALGAAILIYGGIILGLKIMGTEEQRRKYGWGRIISALIIGGIMAFSGARIIFEIGGSSEDTLRQFGQ